MAKAKKIKQQSTSEKLRSLYEMQVIDKEYDRIQRLKGELPLEVEDLEDEITGIENRITRTNEEFAELETELNARKASIDASNDLINKYEKQMDNVKNNREYEALTKEVSIQKLEIQLAEKKIRESSELLESRKESFGEIEELLASKKEELDKKIKELETITKETKKEEKVLAKQRDAAKANVEDRLMKAYERIRSSYKNGLAVVSVERESCGGCFAKIPPQIQIDIDAEKRVTTCEHCGRILTPDYGKLAEAK